MPRTEEANQEIRSAQRAKILAGARVAFARRGLATTMADVAAAAAVSQGLAYRYFAGKDDLYRALVEEALSSSAGPRVEEMTGSPGERLHTLMAILLAGRCERPENFQLLHHVLSDARTPTALLELADRRGQDFAAMLRQLIVEGQATGEVASDDPDQLVTVLIACLDGLSRVAPRYAEQGREHFPDIAIVMRLLGMPAQARQA